MLVLMVSLSFSQTNETVLTLEEYLGYVKKYHPIVKQAELITTESEAKLLKARGAFDPKLEVDYSRKKFKDTEYYDKLNAAFKIPTWYGIELKTNYDDNNGKYLNPEYNTPEGGLYSAGISIPLAKDLLTNKRMATLKQAKIYTKQAVAKQEFVINDILYSAISSYFYWLKSYQDKMVHQDYVGNAQTQLGNVKKSFFAGDKPAVDTLEASINLKTRQLNFEKSKIGYVKSTLELSNFVWLENNLPLELNETITPDINTIKIIDLVLNSSILNSNESLIENHPKLQELQFKKAILTVDKRLKTNNLLPKVNLQYNFLTTEYQAINSFNTADYKSGLNISIPLFLRKERADLKLAKLKLKDINFDIAATRVSLKNKVLATIQEIESYKAQYKILLDLVENYKQLMRSEERKFSLGEGSLFLVNYRGVKLIENELKKNDSEYQVCMSKTNLLRTLNKL